MSFPSDVLADPVWFLYDDTSGQTILKHHFRHYNICSAFLFWFHYPQGNCT